ncbi:hypothetical protein [Chitinophaga japonensis]|uniref:Uncharacterized protein n=1 Tax=Chitinophaga japonensis TaxID=104662 RepID=A0A562T5M8_CHIJA|nr:hypothetical protein [Chitinophaga japonensis]TWI88847.1 hypothetical protein LX66_2934 [Chitinophaga japonensis]
MFGNTALDVAISLIFIFLLYSLLASIVQELIARVFNLRARLLTKALRHILDNDRRKDRLGYLGQFTFFTWFYEQVWGIIYFFLPFFNSPFLKRFYQHPGIRSLRENRASSRPSYISPKLFSQTLMHLLRGPAYDSTRHDEAQLVKEHLEQEQLQLGPETRVHLMNLLEDAKRDAQQFRIKIEQWFDEVMASTSGWYRKQTQVLLIFIGFLIAWQFNVDAIAITRILAKDKKAREQLVALATKRYEAYGQYKDELKRSEVIRYDTIDLGDTTIIRADTVNQVTLEDAALDSIYHSLSADAADVQNILGISRGHCRDTTDTTFIRIRARMDAAAGKLLSPAEQEKYRQAMRTTAQRKVGCYTHPYQQNGWLVFAGWLITAMALSLGAPFWFDLLNKIVQVRATGPQTTTTPDKSKSK